MHHVSGNSSHFFYYTNYLYLFRYMYIYVYYVIEMMKENIVKKQTCPRKFENIRCLCSSSGNLYSSDIGNVIG